MNNKQKIAVIGSGISGLTSAWLLNRRHDVTLYEANDYLGGHTHTVDVQMDGQTLAVDTGFIVFNNRNYPNFIRVLEQLGVAYQPTGMSFSVRNEATGLEYNGSNINTLFAQRKNLYNPGFYRIVADILSFNKIAKFALATGNIADMTLDSFVDRAGLSAPFRQNYLYPMVAAIWSCTVNQAGQFPLLFFLKFFDNHGLLNIGDRPQWYVIKGGSSQYVGRMMKGLEGRIRLGEPVHRIRRSADSVEVYSRGGVSRYNHVVLACHSDQALRLLENPSAEEAEILGAIRYQANSVILHSDAALMPRHKRAWASWNFNVEADGDASERLPLVTYSMNKLQGLASSRPLLVSLNAEHRVDPAGRIREFTYDHPLFSNAMVVAQTRRAEICGRDRTHYCGAYWYNGFHEDGVLSALDVCHRFGVQFQ